MKKKITLPAPQTPPNDQGSSPLITAGKNPFNIPDGYFDSLQSRIQERIAEKKGSTVTVFVWFRQLSRPYKLVSALSVIVLVALTTFIILFHSNGTPSLEELSVDVILEDADAVIDIEELYLVGILINQSTGTDNSGLSETTLAFSSDELSEEDIINYLLSEYDKNNLNIESYEQKYSE
jgi:hypothetical protein